MAFTPSLEGATEQQQQALSQMVIQSPFGSPMRNWFGAYDSTPTTSAFVEQLPGQLTGPGQNAMMAYGALRGGTYEPAPVRDTQWGAPINDPYISWQNDTRANTIQLGPRRQRVLSDCTIECGPQEVFLNQWVAKVLCGWGEEFELWREP